MTPQWQSVRPDHYQLYVTNQLRLEVWRTVVDGQWCSRVNGMDHVCPPPPQATAENAKARIVLAVLDACRVVVGRLEAMR